MKINLDAIKALELKLSEYAEANGTISEYDSANNNRCNGCAVTCKGTCKYMCDGGCGGPGRR